MDKQIIAIGGGAMSARRDSFPLEKYILEQTKKSKPKVCFMATATGDAERNIVYFHEVFSSFNCEKTHLALYDAPKDIESLIMQQDIIYVGAGNTRNLLALWREWHLDKFLYNAWQNGTILAGFSAGSICWYEEGLSDYIPSELNLIKALGFLKGSHCPHFDSEPWRRPIYCELIGNGSMKEGIAVDDDVALHYIGENLHQVVSVNPNGKAYQVQRTEDGSCKIKDLKPNIFLNL